MSEFINKNTNFNKSKNKTERKINPTTGEYEKLIISIEDIKNDEKCIQGTMKCDFLESFEGRNRIEYYIRTKSVNFTFMRGNRWITLIQNASKEN